MEYFKATETLQRKANPNERSNRRRTGSVYRIAKVEESVIIQIAGPRRPERAQA